MAFLTDILGRGGVGRYRKRRYNTVFGYAPVLGGRGGSDFNVLVKHVYA